MTNQHNGEGTQKAFTLLVGPVVGPVGIEPATEGLRSLQSVGMESRAAHRNDRPYLEPACA